MRAARKEQKVRQHELATLVGVKQATISQIESGVIGASVYVPAISLALGISIPHVEVIDSAEEQWIALGRLLRKLGDRRFAKILAMLEAFVEE